MATNDQISKNVGKYNVRFPDAAIPIECPAPEFLEVYFGFFDGVPESALSDEIVESINTEAPAGALT
jgi:hypothetical protein